MYTWRDCGPGCDVNLFGRLLHIVSADKVSRLWMDRQGKAENIFFADNEEMPAELLPSAQAPEPERKRGTRNDPGRRFMLARMGIVDKQLEDVAKFMQFDGQILNFKCVWDDPSLGHEGLRDFELKYYLVDDTCAQHLSSLRDPQRNNDNSSVCVLCSQRLCAGGRGEEFAGQALQDPEEVRLGVAGPAPSGTGIGGDH